MDPLFLMAAAAFLAALVVRFDESFSFRWQPTRHTWAAIGIGGFAFVLSLLMLPFGEGSLGSLILHNVGIYAICGALLPFAYVFFVEKGGYKDLAITRERLPIALALNLFLGAGLAALMVVQADWASVNMRDFWLAAFVLSVGTLFELFLYFGLIHTRLERAFGIIPAILLTSLIYVVWHVGTELTLVENPWAVALNLFFVGILYQSIFSIARNLGAIWPFFAGGGVMLDFVVKIDAISKVSVHYRWAAFALILMLLSIAIVLIVSTGQNSLDTPPRTGSNLEEETQDEEGNPIILFPDRYV